MSLADGEKTVSVVSAGVSTSGDGQIVFDMADPRNGDTEPAEPLLWWATVLTGTASG